MIRRSAEQCQFPTPAIASVVRKIDLLSESSRNRHDLSYNLGVSAKSVFNVGVKLGPIGMHNECAVFHAATRGEIPSVTLQDNKDRLLPNRLRQKVNRRFSSSIEKGNQAIAQSRMEDVVIPTDPEDVIDRDRSET